MHNSKIIQRWPAPNRDLSRDYSILPEMCPGQSLSRRLAAQSPYPLLAINPTRPGGLILCSGPYAEFAGPGAVVYSPVEPVYGLSVALGDVELVPLSEPADCRRAYQLRLQWVNWLRQWVQAPQAEDRVEGVLLGLESLFDAATAIALPTLVLARLAGALPQTVQRVRSQRTALDSAAGYSHAGRISHGTGLLGAPSPRGDCLSHAGAMRIRPGRSYCPGASAPPSRHDACHRLESWLQHVSLWEQPA